jgi:hypothetical protein
MIHMDSELSWCLVAELVDVEGCFLLLLRHESKYIQAIPTLASVSDLVGRWRFRKKWWTYYQSIDKKCPLHRRVDGNGFGDVFGDFL